MIATIPYRWYSDPEQLRREQERVFARSWQYVGRTAEVAEPGSCVAARCGQVPVLVVRGEDGALRGFLNVCRHRGSVLVEDSGPRRALRCPYHAWTYGHDGRLRAAPRADREPGFEPEQLALVPVAVDTWGPFLFANPDAAAEPLAEALGELPALLAEVVDVGGLRFHSRSRFALGANWKVPVENFLECYGPERTERFLDYFFAADADPGRIREFLAYDDRIGREDTAMIESVHRGMRDGLLERGTLLEGGEQLIASFQAWLRRQLDD